MNLYEINREIEDCMVIDEETGEVTFDEERIASLQMERDKKIESIALWIKNLSADAEAIKKEKLALADRQTAAERKAEHLKRYLASVLDGNKFSTPKVDVGFRRSTRVELDEDKFFDAGTNQEYMKMSVSPDKTKIKAALKQGLPVLGAGLVDVTNIVIR